MSQMAAASSQLRGQLGVVGVALLVGLGLSGCGGSPPAVTTRLVFLHLNDHHGHLPEEDLPINRTLAGIGELTRPDSDIYVKYGGYPMIASLTAQLERESAVRDETLFKLHIGDALTGTAYYSLFKHGEPDALMMSELCFDAFELGNHEFDNGDQNLAYFLESLVANSSAKCDRAPTLLGANVVPGPTSPLNGKIRAYDIIERDGISLGLVGINTKAKTIEAARPSHGTTLTDEVPAAQAAVDELISQGIKHIVVMSHVGYAFDTETLSQQLTGVDVILGGDSHSLLADDYAGALLKGFGIRPTAEYPKMVTNAEGKSVCVGQAWDHAHILGQMFVDFNEDGDVTACSGTPYVAYDETSFYEEYTEEMIVNGATGERVVTAALTGEDLLIAQQGVSVLPGFRSAPRDATFTKMTELLSVYTAAVEEKKQLQVGSASTTLYKERFPGQYNAAATWKHGNDIAPVQGKVWLDNFQHGCIALINAGSIRENINEGQLSYNDLLVVHPFGYLLVEMTVQGKYIKQLLEEIFYSIKLAPDRSGSFAYGRGIRHQIDLSQSEGNLVSNIEVNCKVAGDWIALNESESYVVVVTDVGAEGKDGWFTLADTVNIPDRTISGLVDLEVMVEYTKGLAEQGLGLTKAPFEEYSVQRFVDADGCDHSVYGAGQCPSTKAQSVLV